MKKITTFLAGLLAFAINPHAQAQQKTQPNNQSLLWRISGKHLAKPSFIFGTMHLICVDDYVWTPKMKESLDKCDNVCFEMNLQDPSIITEVAAGLIDMSGKKLEDYFTPDQYKLLDRYLKDSLSLDIALFQQMKPVALQSIISTSGINCNNPVSYEDSIMKTALKGDKKILGLEQPNEQLAALESIPVDTVIKELLAEIQNTDKNDSEYYQLIAAYKNQDIAALYTLIVKSKDMGEDMGVFLDDRNKKWIARMTDKMKGTSVFFAVGAGHLWGGNGVISLLRKDGYTVESMK